MGIFSSIHIQKLTGSKDVAKSAMDTLSTVTGFLQNVGDGKYNKRMESAFQMAGKASTVAVNTAGRFAANRLCDLSDTLKLGAAVVDKNPQQAIGVAGNFLSRRKSKVVNSVKAVSDLAKEAKYYAINRNQLTEKDKAKLMDRGLQLGGIFATIIVAGELIHSLDLDSGFEDTGLELLHPEIDIDSLDYIDNGVFAGTEADLDQLISLGELEDTEHVQVLRDPHMVSAFYTEHNLVPTPGYEVHHIIPLCEGGSDTPDNMVLIASDLHDRITAAHSSFYGWHSGNCLRKLCCNVKARMYGYEYCVSAVCGQLYQKE